MRKFKQLLLLVISITLVSCHTTGSIKQKAWKVQQGMTTEEIGQLLGKPDFRRFDGSLEQWEYQSGGIATSCKFLIIEFRNGKVTSMDSYNEIAKETSVGDLYSSKISLDTVGSIDDNEFEKIYNETKNSVFKDSTLEKAIINKKLSCAQCLKLMSLYTFDNDKLNRNKDKHKSYFFSKFAFKYEKSNEESKHNNCSSIDLPDRYEHNRLAWQTSRS